MQALFSTLYPPMDIDCWYYEYMEPIKRRIQNRMAELKMRQDELALKAGISQSTVNRVLNSPTKNRLDTIQKIADALRLPLEYLIAEDEKKALLYLSIYNMNDEDLQETSFYIEKEKLWKERRKAE